MSDVAEFPTVASLLRAFSRGDLTPEDATEAALARIEATEPTLNAFQLVDEAGARQAAAATRRWAAGQPLGPMDGIPLSIKDIVATKDWPTLSGSRTVDANGPWDTDAPPVARLREGGAVILGKTTTPDCAWPTRRPWAGPRWRRRFCPRRTRRYGYSRTWAPWWKMSAP